MPELSNMDASKVRQAFYETKWTPELVGRKNAKFCVYYSELNSMNPLMVSTKAGLNVPYAHYRMHSNSTAQTKEREIGNSIVKKLTTNSKYLPESCAFEDGSLRNQIFMTGLHVFRDELDWNNNPLTIVEGAKKAFYLCSKGVPAVGMLGVTGFYTTKDKEGNKCTPRFADSFVDTGLQAYVNAHLQKYFNGKEAELRLILDADVFDGDDKRRHIFLTSITTFSKLYKGFNISFACPDRDMGEKGIDDLLNTLDAGVDVNKCLEIWDLTDKSKFNSLKNEFVKTKGVDKYVTVEKTMLKHGVQFRSNMLKYATEVKWTLSEDESDREWHIMSDAEKVVFRARAEYDGRKLLPCDLDDALLNYEVIAPKYSRLKDFETLISKWDGVSRWDDFIQHINLTHESDRPQLSRQLKNFLIRTLACTFKTPRGVYNISKKDKSSIAENRTAFVFYSSGESIGKSKFWESMLGEFKDLCFTGSYADDKDYRIETTRNIFMNLDELDTNSPAEIKQMKSLISIRSLRDRLPYEKSAIERNRICSFVGSTNRNNFLPASDKNTRWIVFDIQGFNYSDVDGYMQYDLMDIWAELYDEWKADVLCGQVTDEDLLYIQRVAKCNIATSQEADYIAETFETTDDESVSCYRVDDVVGILNIEFPNSKINTANVRSALKNMCGDPLQKKTLISGKLGRGYRLKRVANEYKIPNHAKANDKILDKMFKSKCS